VRPEGLTLVWTQNSHHTALPLGFEERPMEEEQIIIAIERARKGISQYLEIMDCFPAVDVARDLDFQRRFNAFYRVRQRPRRWYEEYFSFMERRKEAKPTFDEVLDHLYASLGRYEPSFSSKLVATIDPNQPVWDVFVLKNTQTRVPSYASQRKIEQAKTAYRIIQEWYRQFLISNNGKFIVDLFNRIVPEHPKITDLKKMDFVLWQTRA
jgi:hypothetical protein